MIHQRYGPRQIKNAPYNEVGRLNVDVKFAPFSCTRRRAPLRVRSEVTTVIDRLTNSIVFRMQKTDLSVFLFIKL